MALMLIESAPGVLINQVDDEALKTPKYARLMVVDTALRACWSFTPKRRPDVQYSGESRPENAGRFHGRRQNQAQDPESRLVQGQRLSHPDLQRVPLASVMIAVRK